MERLTVPYEYGDGYRSKCAETCGECDGCWGLYEIVNRLGAYEDTELTPEEVNDSVVGAKLMAKAQLVSAFGVAAERLRELAEADKAGRLVVLPCQSGERVLALLDDQKHVRECVVKHAVLDGGRKVFYISPVGSHGNAYSVPFEAFGKTVFPIREEAEKALEAMNDE